MIANNIFVCDCRYACLILDVRELLINHLTPLFKRLATETSCLSSAEDTIKVRIRSEEGHIASSLGQI